MLEDWDPYHLWLATYNRYLEDDSYFYCFDCVYYKNIGNNGLKNGLGYSVLVAYLNPLTDSSDVEPIPVSLANLTITGEDSTVSNTWVNDPSSS